jgi:hypothetical protein
VKGNVVQPEEQSLWVINVEMDKIKNDESRVGRHCFSKTIESESLVIILDFINGIHWEYNCLVLQLEYGR